MYMWFPLNLLPRSFIENLFDFWNVSLSIEVIFFLLISVHNKILKLVRYRLEGFIRNFIFTKR
ncbi:hypothetical protein SRABI13_04324 [Erwinia aphidicola]|nr:hypothetical protein SRABI13_04324 [Erwinia aphidicola]